MHVHSAIEAGSSTNARLSTHAPTLKLHNTSRGIGAVVARVTMLATLFSDHIIFIAINE